MEYNYFTAYGEYTHPHIYINERHEKVYKLRMQGVAWVDIVEEVDTSSIKNARILFHKYKKRMMKYDEERAYSVEQTLNRFNSDKKEAEKEYAYLTNILNQIKELANG